MTIRNGSDVEASDVEQCIDPHDGKIPIVCAEAYHIVKLTLRCKAYVEGRHRTNFSNESDFRIIVLSLTFLLKSYNVIDRLTMTSQIPNLLFATRKSCWVLHGVDSVTTALVCSQATCTIFFSQRLLDTLKGPRVRNRPVLPIAVRCWFEI